MFQIAMCIGFTAVSGNWDRFRAVHLLIVLASSEISPTSRLTSYNSLCTAPPVLKQYQPTATEQSLEVVVPYII